MANSLDGDLLGGSIALVDLTGGQPAAAVLRDAVLSYSVLSAANLRGADLNMPNLRLDVE